MQLILNLNWAFSFDIFFLSFFAYFSFLFWTLSLIRMSIVNCAIGKSKWTRRFVYWIDTRIALWVFLFVLCTYFQMKWFRLSVCYPIYRKQLAECNVFMCLFVCVCVWESFINRWIATWNCFYLFVPFLSFNLINNECICWEV